MSGGPLIEIITWSRYAAECGCRQSSPPSPGQSISPRNACNPFWRCFERKERRDVKWKWGTVERTVNHECWECMQRFPHIKSHPVSFVRDSLEQTEYILHYRENKIIPRYLVNISRCPLWTIFCVPYRYLSYPASQGFPMLEENSTEGKWGRCHGRPLEEDIEDPLCFLIEIAYRGRTGSFLVQAAVSAENERILITQP